MKKKCLWLLFTTLATAQVILELEGEFRGFQYPMLHSQQSRKPSLYVHRYKESVSKANSNELKLFGITPSLMQQVIQSHIWFFYRKVTPPPINLDLSKIIKVVKVKSAHVISVTPLSPVDITNNFNKCNFSIHTTPIYNNITSIWMGPMSFNETITFLVSVKGLVGDPVMFSHPMGEKLWHCFKAPPFVLYPKVDKSHSADEYFEAKILALRAAIVLQIDYQISLAGLIKCNLVESMPIDKLLEEQHIKNGYISREIVNLNVFYKSEFAEIVHIY